MGRKPVQHKKKAAPLCYTNRIVPGRVDVTNILNQIFDLKTQGVLNVNLAMTILNNAPSGVETEALLQLLRTPDWHSTSSDFVDNWRWKRDLYMASGGYYLGYLHSETELKVALLDWASGVNSEDAVREEYFINKSKWARSKSLLYKELGGVGSVSGGWMREQAELNMEHFGHVAQCCNLSRRKGGQLGQKRRRLASVSENFEPVPDIWEHDSVFEEEQASEGAALRENVLQQLPDHDKTVMVRVTEHHSDGSSEQVHLLAGLHLVPCLYANSIPEEVRTELTNVSLPSVLTGRLRGIVC